MILRYESSNELYHHGVKGMRWGVRKARRTIARDLRKARKLNNKETDAAVNAYASIGTRRKEKAMLKYNKRKAMADAQDQKMRADAAERRAFAKQATQSWFQKNANKLAAAVAIGAGAVVLQRVMKNKKLRRSGIKSSSVQSLVAAGREYIRF